MKRFGHLNIPETWEQYWSKYPQGYTVLESLINWVSQVDDMVDNQNETVETVEKYGIRLDGFIEQYDTSLQTTLEKTLSEWQKSGFLDVVIDAALQTQMDNLQDSTEDQLNTFNVQLTETKRELSLATSYISQTALNVKQPPFNAVGDGVTDDTVAINKALALGGEIYIPEGVYMINVHGDHQLILRSNTVLTLHPKAVLKAIPNNYGSYNVLQIYSVENVLVQGGTIQGERNEHTGVIGEWGHGVNISQSKNIRLKEITIEDAWGDGIYIGGTTASTHITLENLIVDNSRRNNISVVHCQNLVGTNVTVTNANGTAPQCGIDIEPNPGDQTNNIVFENVIAYGNLSSGVYVAFDAKQVTLDKVYSYNNGSGIYVAGSAARRGYENSVLNSYCYNNRELGLYLAYATDSVIKNCYSTINGTGGLVETYGVNNLVSGVNILRNFGDGVVISFCNHSNYENNKIYYSTKNGFRSGGGSELTNSNISLINNYIKGNTLTNLSLNHISRIRLDGNEMRKNGENNVVTPTNINFGISVGTVWFNNNDMFDCSSGINVYGNASNVINSGNINKSGEYSTTLV